MVEIRVGSRFSTFKDLEQAVYLFGKERHTAFWKREARTIENVKRKNHEKNLNPELKYYIIKYACINGGRVHTKKSTDGSRKSKTYRINCPVYIHVVLSLDNTALEVRGMHLEHNHIVSEEIFNSLPKVRKLSTAYQEKVQQYMKLKVDKKMLLQQIRNETKKSVTMRDLLNIAKKKVVLKSNDEETALATHDISLVENQEAGVTVTEESAGASQEVSFIENYEDGVTVSQEGYYSVSVPPETETIVISTRQDADNPADGCTTSYRKILPKTTDDNSYSQEVNISSDSQRNNIPKTKTADNSPAQKYTLPSSQKVNVPKAKQRNVDSEAILLKATESLNYAREVFVNEDRYDILGKYIASQMRQIKDESLYFQTKMSLEELVNGAIRTQLELMNT